MNTIIFAVLIGVGIGIVVGALGAGGGILSVPVLVYLMGLKPHDATGASLVIVGLTAIVALRHPIKTRNIAWREGLIFGACTIVGAAVASRLSVLVPSKLLMVSFALLLLAVSALMAKRALRARAEERSGTLGRAAESVGDSGVPTATDSEAPDQHFRPSIVTLIAAATFTGVLTGSFGVGGGFLAVPMLVMALRLPMRVASGTSLLVMIMSSASAFVARLGTPMHVDWASIVLFAAGSTVGGLLGGPLSAKVRPSTLTFCFAALLLVIGVFTLVTTLVR